MRKYTLLVAGLGLALSGCSVSVGSDEPNEPEASEPMSASELEETVADGVTPDDPDAEVSAECDGELTVEVNATQDCHVTVGEEFVNVHVVVTEVDGDELVDADITPYIPGDRLAEVAKAELGRQGTALDTVQCDEELLGEVGATTTCSVTAGNQEASLEIEATEVDGLFINFHMQVVE